MKLPKFNIKTEFWQEYRWKEWQNRYTKLNFAYLIIIVANMIHYIWTSNLIMFWINMLWFTLGTIIYISYNKRKRDNEV